MKIKTTVLLGAATMTLALAAYFFDHKKQEIKSQKQDADSQIIYFNLDQINMFEIQKKKEKIVLQKSENGWTLLEPIQDRADNTQVEDLLKTLTTEKMITFAKESETLTAADLKEFGLDVPAAVYVFKNNAGKSEKISVGTQKNFEGNSFLRIDSDNRVLVAGANWLAKADNNLLYFREKRLYRGNLGDITLVIVKSLQDKFELKRVDNVWAATGHEFLLDQNKVREMLRRISETSIQEYVFEGEPSANVLKEKGLIKSPVELHLNAAESTWAVSMNQNEKERALFALTDRPTSFVRLDITEWEFFGNLSLDSLRDRTTLTRFSLDEVRKVYFKSDNKEVSFVKEGDLWKLASPLAEGKVFSETELVKSINRLHDFEISEFVDKGSEVFKGSNMLILKTDSDRLVYQLNWGPELKLKRKGAEKDYFYARTQLDPLIFAVEKSKIQALGFQQIIQDSQVTSGDMTKKEEP
ncbi:MAG: DUF4340 domain-containing protein [Bdellovibrio sp.]|nr:DUF4340 domain-containing protein [Bdellovibrio sp.]